MENLINSTIIACAQSGAVSTAFGASHSQIAFSLLQSAFYTPINKISSLAFSNISLSSDESPSSKITVLKKLIGVKKITSRNELKNVLASVALSAACALPATVLSQSLHDSLGYEGEDVESSLTYHVGVFAAWNGGMTLLGHLLGCILENEEEQANGS